MVERSLRHKRSCAATFLRTPHPQFKILIIMIIIILIIITILITVAAYVSQNEKWDAAAEVIRFHLNRGWGVLKKVAAQEPFCLRLLSTM